MSLAQSSPMSPLDRHLKACLATAREFNAALPLVNDPRIHTHFQPVIELTERTLAQHINKPLPSVADDLFALKSLFDRFDIESDDDDFGRNQGLRALRGIQGNLLRDIDKTLKSATDLGLVVTAPLFPLPDAAMLERAGREGQLQALNDRLREVENKLNSTIAPEANVPSVTVQQQGLINFYVNSMKIELALARIETTIKELIDLTSLSRAIEKTVTLTTSFIETVKGAASRMTETLQKAAPVMGTLVTKGVRGLRGLIQSVRKRERIKRVPTPPPLPDPGPPPADFDMDEVRAMILRGEAPPARWVPWIKELHLSNTQITDLKPLEKLTALTKLNLRNTQTDDITPLQNLSALTELNLRNTQINDIKPLQKLPALKKLNLRNTQIDDIMPLRELIALSELYLSFTQINDITSLQNLTALRELDLNSTQVTNITPLQNIIALTELNLRNTQISDIKPLQNLTELTELNLRNTQITDLKPLEKLTALKAIYVEKSRIAALARSLGRKGVVQMSPWVKEE